MIKTFSNSWALFKASVAVLQQDKELLWFPVLSTLAAILVGVTFLVPLGLLAAGGAHVGEGDQLPPAFYLGLFVFYVVQYFVIFFFNTALVGAALKRLDGGNPTVRDGLHIAGQRVGTIFGYAVIASTVGIILRAVEERVGLVGQIIVGLLGVAWTVASFLVVPVLATRDVGPIDAVKHSASLLKQSWGENIAGHAGFGLIFLFVYLGVFALILALGVPLARLDQTGEALQPPLVALGIFGVLALVMIAIVQSALKGIYSAALYRYATDEGSTDGFSQELLSSAFKSKG